MVLDVALKCAFKSLIFTKAFFLRHKSTCFRMDFWGTICTFTWIAFSEWGGGLRAPWIWFSHLKSYSRKEVVPLWSEGYLPFSGATDCVGPRSDTLKSHDPHVTSSSYSHCNKQFLMHSKLTYLPIPTFHFFSRLRSIWVQNLYICAKCTLYNLYFNKAQK